MSKLSHLDEEGAARMVDVSAKPPTEREAIAEATVTLSADALSALAEGTVPKGDALAVARVAGIMAAKKTADLIPLCHPLPLSAVNVELELVRDNASVVIRATVKTVANTGVEMEALTAATIAALALYDMIKSIDKSATIEGVRLISKSGGKSGRFSAPDNTERRKSDTASRPTRQQASVIMDVATAAPPRKPGTGREAFRAFMLAHRLRASAWANEAGVSSSQIYAYLTGRLHALPAEVVEKLARAARVRPEDIFR
jgi:cyclic pyranopterin monophosphate synthase